MKQLTIVLSLFLFVGCDQEADLTLEDATLAIETLHQYYNPAAMLCPGWNPTFSNINLGEEMLLSADGAYWAANADLDSNCHDVYKDDGTYPFNISHNYHISRDGYGGWKATPDGWKPRNN